MRLKFAQAIPSAISIKVARLTVPIWQSVTASQRKLYLIPVTAGVRHQQVAEQREHRLIIRSGL